MIKRISVLLILTFLSLSFSGYAEENAIAAVEINSLSNEAIVGEEFSEILFSAPAGSFVSLSMDGTEIFNGISSGNNTASVEDVSLGEHTVLLKSVVDDEIKTDSVKFTKKKSVFKTIDNVSFRDFGTYEAGVDKDGNKVYAFPGKFPGRDESEEGSVGYILENLASKIITKGSLAYEFNIKEFANDIKDKFTISFDLKINNTSYVEFEMKNADGAFINPGGKQLFKSNYSIGTTGKNFQNNEWMLVEIVFDVPAQTIAIFINGEKVINEYKSGAHLRGLQFLRFLFCPLSGVATQGYMVDNFKMTTESRYLGFDKGSYKTGDTFTEAFDNNVTDAFSEIRFKTDMVLDIFTSDFTVKCFADGREVMVESVSEETIVNEGSNLRENYLCVKLGSTLSGESDLKFVFENTAFDDEKVIFEKNLSLCTGEFGIGSMEYFVGSKPCISSGQLKAGDTFKAKFNLRNYSSQSAVCVVGIYSGEKLVALSGKTLEGAMCEVSVLVPEGENSYRAECFIMDSYSLRKSLSNTKFIGGSGI